MKKRKLWLNSILVVLCLFLFTPYANAISVELVPGLDPIIVGDTFDVDVFVNGVDIFNPILSFGFDVTCDPEFAYQGATVGPYFWDDSASFGDTEVAGSYLFGVSGDVLLASLTFEALAVGNDLSLGIISDLTDLNEGLLTLSMIFNLSESIIDLSSSINLDVAPIPEPATMLLLGSGLVGLAGLRRKKMFGFNKRG